MNKRRIVLSAIIGTIALSALSLSFSLAWYASSDRLGVNTVEIAVQATRGLKISKSEDLDSFVSEYREAPSDFLFSPVSAMNQSLWMDEKGDTPKFYDCSNYLVPSSGEPKQEETQRGFYQQTFYLLTDSNYYVTLDVDRNDDNQLYTDVRNGDNTAKAQEIYHDIPDLGLSVEEIKAKLDELINSLRISILIPDENYYEYYIIDPYKKQDQNGDYIETIYGGRLDNSRDGFFDTYESIGDDDKYIKKEVVYGEINDRSLICYDGPVNPSGEHSNEDEPSIVRHFFGDSFHPVYGSIDAAYTFNEEASYENGLTIAKEKSYSFDELRTSDPGIKIPCKANTPRKIIVSFYLEGWDTDCINYTMGSSFDIDLSFKLLKVIDKETLGRIQNIWLLTLNI